MDWQTKSKMFSIINKVPYSTSVHHFFQTRVLKSFPRSDNNYEQMLVASSKINELFQQNCSLPSASARFIEIGAGRDLITPICLRALGVKEVCAIDIEELAKLKYINHAASFVSKSLGVSIPVFKSFNDLEDYGITYIPNLKLQELDSATEKFDCLYSSDTLEHIEVKDLEEIHKSAQSLLNQEGALIHFIDVSDHYARSDPTITRFNFLKFTDTEWKKYNHSNHFCNRLRPNEYKDIFTKTDWVISSYDVDVEPDRILNIDSLAPPFREMDPDDLWALRLKVVVKKEA